ncbi:lipocalin family protein [Pseudomonas phoenicis]|uniref:lipocalin family protein n=1 Tax=unclassified Pseudomonas TaxID=196821 RepID=UPI0039A33F4E
MRAFAALMAACCLALLGGCASPASDPLAPKTAGNVSLKRYQGTWYELARLPMAHQDACAQSEAHYNLKPDGSFDVLNRCRTLGDEWLRAQGHASVQASGHTDKLWVEFDNSLSRLLPGMTRADYWILYVDERYRTAIVGSPDRKHLWILSRAQHLSAWERESLLAKARQQGYDTTRLIWRMPDRNIAKMH